MKKLCISLLLCFVSLVSYSDTKANMTNKLKKIDMEINSKKLAIKKIDTQKKSLEEQIEDIRKDIVKLNEDKKNIEDDIEATLKKIDYSHINLDFSKKELERKKAEFQAKIIAWSRRKNNNLSFEEDAMLKRQFGKILYDDMKKIEHIKRVKQNISIVSANIENEKKKLSSLKNQLNRNIQATASKEKEKNRLIARLNSEKSRHISRLSSLEKEKARIQKEIEKIIYSQSVSKPSKSVDYSVAIKGLGKGVKPLEDGKVVVQFREKKTQNISSNGVEIESRLGAPVRTTHKGKVIYVGKIQGLGKVVMIDYGYNTIGVYGNLISSKVTVGKKVNQGEDIGVLGLSMDGKPVLYYEVRLNLKSINPINVL